MRQTVFSKHQKIVVVCCCFQFINTVNKTIYGNNMGNNPELPKHDSMFPFSKSVNAQLFNTNITKTVTSHPATICPRNYIYILIVYISKNCSHPLQFPLMVIKAALT